MALAHITNPDDLTNKLIEWIEQDSSYEILYKGENELNEKTIEIQIITTKNIVKITILKNPLRIYMGSQLLLSELHQEIYNLFNTADSIIFNQNMKVNLLQFNAEILFEYNNLNELASILLQKQIYPDDLTRNKFFDYLGEIVRAQRTIQEFLNLEQYKKRN